MGRKTKLTPSQQRYILDLYYADALSQDVIATRMERSIKTIADVINATGAYAKRVPYAQDVRH